MEFYITAARSNFFSPPPPPPPMKARNERPLWSTINILLAVVGYVVIDLYLSFLRKKRHDARNASLTDITEKANKWQ